MVPEKDFLNVLFNSRKFNRVSIVFSRTETLHWLEVRVYTASTLNVNSIILNSIKLSSLWFCAKPMQWAAFQSQLDWCITDLRVKITACWDPKIGIYMLYRLLTLQNFGINKLDQLSTFQNLSSPSFSETKVINKCTFMHE